MKSLSLFLCAMVLMFVIIRTSNAALWDRGGGLIYDDVLNITWLQDAGYLASSYGSAILWAASLDYYDSVRDTIWDSWRLPSAYGQDGSKPEFGFVSGSEMGHMYYNNLSGTEGGPVPSPIFVDGYGNTSSFLNLQAAQYWANENNGYYSWDFDFSIGYQGNDRTAVPDHFAWAVLDGDVGAVPIPAAVWLLGSGLIEVIWLRKKIRMA